MNTKTKVSQAEFDAAQRIIVDLSTELGAISADLGLGVNDDGLPPILSAIEKLKALAAPAVVKESLTPEPTVQHKRSSDDAPRQCWSANEEDYNSNSLAELLDGHPHLTAGSVVWCGEPCTPDASELFDADDAMEMMRDRACDIAGEYGDDYPNVSTEDVAELNSLIIGWINSKAAPTFYTVKNVQPYTLTAIDVGQQAEA